MGEFDDLISEFVTESREHIADIEDDLIKIESEMENVDPEVINRVFRAAHSIKGSAKFLDLSNIGDLAHIMEDVLNLIRSGKLKPTHEVAGPLLQSADMLKSMFEDVTASNDMDISEHVEQLRRVRDGEIGPSAKATKRAKPQAATARFKIDPAKLAAKLAQGQVFVLKLDKADERFDTIIAEIDNLGETLDRQTSGGLEQILFATILEPNMIPLALNLDQDHFTGVSKDMISEITGQTPPVEPARPAEVTAPAAQEASPPKENLEPEEVAAESNAFITFLLADETYAVPIQMIEEIIGVQELSLLPNVPDFIKGVINLRGELVPIMDLRLKFNLARREWDQTTVFLIIRTQERVVGMVVDQVSDVLVIEPEKVQKTPMFATKISSDCINGVYKDESGQMVILINIAHLIDPEEWLLRKAS